jgi:hypothetical protein
MGDIGENASVLNVICKVIIDLLPFPLLLLHGTCHQCCMSDLDIQFSIVEPERTSPSTNPEGRISQLAASYACRHFPIASNITIGTERERNGARVLNCYSPEPSQATPSSKTAPLKKRRGSETGQCRRRDA